MRFLFYFTVMILLALPAEASESYVSIFGGVSRYIDLDADSTFVQPTRVLDNEHTAVDFDNGSVLGFAIGTGVADHIRAEIEFSYEKLEAETFDYTASFNPANTGIYEASGALVSYNVLANLWYDFDNQTAFTPYVGGGIGVGFVDSNIRYLDTVTSGLLGDDVAFSYQLGAGISWDLSEFASLNIGYRFKGLPSLEFSHARSDPGVVSESHDADLYSHALLLGITWRPNW